MNEVKDKVSKDNPTVVIKKTRHRSPNYPAISLDKAIEQAKVLYDPFKTTWVPERTAHETWGNAPFGSQGLLCTAALKAYGLITFEGSGKARKVMVTDHVRRILLDADEKESLLRESALLPPLHKELWSHYQGFLPKRDEDLKKYLLLEKHFNDQAVGGFIAQFRATIALANPQNGVILPEEGEGESENQTGGPDGSSLKPKIEKPLPPKTPVQRVPVKGEGMRELKFLLPSGEAVLWLPIQMEASDFAILKTYMDAFKQASEAVKTPPVKEGDPENA